MDEQRRLTEKGLLVISTIMAIVGVSAYFFNPISELLVFALSTGIAFVVVLFLFLIERKAPGRPIPRVLIAAIGGIACVGFGVFLRSFPTGGFGGGGWYGAIPEISTWSIGFGLATIVATIAVWVSRD
jgi:hypothetical protein